ncbi:MAG TPA: hypothetical protein VFH45_12050 [Acidimicrobiales bacterium]|nr:hypothetical protein [Acidimicrobiales bacterium]
MDLRHKEPSDAEARLSRTMSAVGSRVSKHADTTRERLKDTTVGSLWERLNAMNFIDRGMLFAAILLLCFVPFMIVVASLAGHDAATGMVRRFGLNRQASTAFNKVFTSPSATSGALSGASYVFFITGGIAAAASLQELYEAAFGLTRRGLRDTPRRLVWLGALLGFIAFTGWAGPWLHRHAGPVAIGIGGLAAFGGFWWFTMWFLLGGRLTWRELLPSALATGVCWVGMVAVFRLTMSSSVIGNYQKYGPIGVVFSIMSFLIAVGVVVILGALFGVVWRERHQSDRAGSDGAGSPGSDEAL